MEGFSMLVDIETTKDQLSQVAVSLKHISFNKRHYGDCIEYSSFLQTVHKLKMAIYFNYSQNEGFDVDWCGRTMLHDVVTRYERPVSALRYQIFHMLGNLRVKKWTIWIIKIMLSQKIGYSTWDSRNFKS
jgi:hypothetical protein